MESSETAAALFGDLRRLAAENPRDARLRFAALLDANASTLDELLRLAAAPGEGRLRQLIANAVKNRTDKTRVVSHMSRWLEVETDEFTKAALRAALADVGSEIAQSPLPPDLPHIVDTYRYVADRLCHRVRNSLTGAAQHLRALDGLLGRIPDPQAREAYGAVGQLKDAFRALSRIVEFDTDDSYFEWRVVDLKAWLKAMTDRYVAKHNPLTLRIMALEERYVIRVQANDFLLETLFWNLWKNALQAVNSVCEITVRIGVEEPNVHLLVMDNGGGFTAEDAETAFVDRFRRRGANYGRGLLEVQDAVRRLRGGIALVPLAAGEYRIKLTLPLATS